MTTTYAQQGEHCPLLTRRRCRHSTNAPNCLVRACNGGKRTDQVPGATVPGSMAAMQTPLNAAPLFYALRTHLSARLFALAGSPPRACSAPPPDVCTPVSTCSADGAARAARCMVSRRSGVIQCLNVVLQRLPGGQARRPIKARGVSTCVSVRNRHRHSLLCARASGALAPILSNAASIIPAHQRITASARSLAHISN